MPYITRNKIKNIVINITISIVSVVFSIFLTEVVFYFILKSHPSPRTYTMRDKESYAPDSILGYVNKKNLEVKTNMIVVGPSKHDTSLIYKAVMRTDSLGNRLIDILGMQNRKKYAIFFGCSFTFGVGVEDTQTIPYCFAKYDTIFCVYNFGVCGYGTQQMLAKLEYTNLRKIIKQDSGVCFYLYMYEHPNRVIADMQTYSWNQNMPYYGYKHNRLFYYGTFNRDRKFLSGFYTLMGKSNVIKYFKINFPNKLKPKHYKLTCDIIYKSYLEYRKQFHNDNFYVIIYPTIHREILDYLQRYDIKVLDFSELFDANKDQYAFKFDTHPTALAYKVFTEHLVDTINKLERK